MDERQPLPIPEQTLQAIVQVEQHIQECIERIQSAEARKEVLKQGTARVRLTSRDGSTKRESFYDVLKELDSYIATEKFRLISLEQELKALRKIIS